MRRREEWDTHLARGEGEKKNKERTHILPWGKGKKERTHILPWGKGKKERTHILP